MSKWSSVPQFEDLSRDVSHSAIAAMSMTSLTPFRGQVLTVAHRGSGGHRAPSGSKGDMATPKGDGRTESPAISPCSFALALLAGHPHEVRIWDLWPERTFRWNGQKAFIKQQSLHVTQPRSSTHESLQAPALPSAADVPKEARTTKDEADERGWKQPKLAGPRNGCVTREWKPCSCYVCTRQVSRSSVILACEGEG